MTIDLVLLLWAVALAFIHIVVAAAGASGQIGFGTLAGNRDNLPELTGWAARARRAQQNMFETLPLFIALVLMAHIARRTDSISVLGEQAYLVARVGYLVIYLAGIPWLRTAVWGVSVLGMALIFLELL